MHTVIQLRMFNLVMSTVMFIFILYVN